MPDAEKDAPVLCGRADLTRRYACNLPAQHDGAHMELTDRHTAAWDLFRSPATTVLPPAETGGHE